MKMLVSCPTCETMGVKQILGEIKDGCFIIMRFHNGFTTIRGEFEVLCSTCGEPVYFKTMERRENGISSNRSQWIYREGSLQQINQIGTLGSAVI